jgi:hypothetical protein
MIRVASLSVFVAAVAGLAGGPARAQLPVAPPPREVRTDGTRDPAPPPEAPAKAEDPAAVVDRIIKNSKDVGDKLAKTDTGTDTRKKQDKILSDINALINRQEDPPPPKPDDKDKNKDPMMDKDPMTDKDPMKKPDMPPPKTGDMPMDKGMGTGKDDMPMAGMNDPPMPMGGSGRKPRMGDPMGGDKKEPDKADPKPGPMGTEKKPGGGDKEPKDPKNPSGFAGGNPGGKPPPKASLPFDEDVAKDVWGHLPDKLRQQMTQYYKEDVMPKYAELLRLYYSSLSEKGGPSVPPKK